MSHDHEPRSAVRPATSSRKGTEHSNDAAHLAFHITGSNAGAAYVTSSVSGSSALHGSIVIADDDAPTRALLAQILGRAQFAVHACENGLLACDAVRRERPDVILLDWVMPVMDGRAAVERLKADVETRGIPIIMLTAQSEIDERVVALEAGVQDFVTKPFDARELVARIEQQMRWRKTLAVDANTAFAADRLKLYRPSVDVQTSPGDSNAAPSIFDRIWATSPKKRQRA